MGKETEVIELPDVTCLICGASPARRFYGAIACSACKNFFLRLSAAGSTKLVCPQKGDCAANSFLNQGRYKCQSCRYKKCLEAGMIPEITARRHGCTLRDKISGKSKKNELPTKVIEFIEAETKLASATCGSSAMVPKKNSNSLSIIRQLINAEIEICSEEPSTSLTFDYDFDIDVHLIDALKAPLRLCARRPMGFHPMNLKDPRIVFAGNLPARRFTRQVQMVIDWLKVIPEFHELCEKDQEILTCRQNFIQPPLLMFYRSFKFEYEGMLMGLGAALNPGPSEMLQLENIVIETASINFVAYGVAVILRRFKKLQIEEEEYILLRTLALFYTTLQYTDNGAIICRKAFNKYSIMLLEHIRSKRQSEAEVVSRFNDLMSINSYLQVGAEFACHLLQTMGQMIAFRFARHILSNFGGLDGQLSRDIMRYA